MLADTYNAQKNASIIYLGLVPEWAVPADEDPWTA